MNRRFGDLDRLWYKLVGAIEGEEDKEAGRDYGKNGLGEEKCKIKTGVATC